MPRFAEQRPGAPRTAPSWEAAQPNAKRLPSHQPLMPETCFKGAWSQCGILARVRGEQLLVIELCLSYPSRDHSVALSVTQQLGCQNVQRNDQPWAMLVSYDQPGNDSVSGQ